MNRQKIHLERSGPTFQKNPKFLFAGVFGAVTFPHSSQGGTAYSFNDVPNSQGFLNLGTYPHPEHCFPVPDLCGDGISVAFWIWIFPPWVTGAMNMQVGDLSKLFDVRESGS